MYNNATGRVGPRFWSAASQTGLRSRRPCGVWWLSPADAGHPPIPSRIPPSCPPHTSVSSSGCDEALDETVAGETRVAAIRSAMTEACGEPPDGGVVVFFCGFKCASS